MREFVQRSWTWSMYMHLHQALRLQPPVYYYLLYRNSDLQA